MKIHRFYTGPGLKLKKDLWLHDPALLWQWNKVLRFREGQQITLFDGTQTDRLYRIVKLDKTEAHLQMVTELNRHLPDRHLYIFWSLLKKDNNDLILQKCTELGVSTFVPLLSSRSIRDNFNMDRAHKVVLEASEQCGRSDLPSVRDPMHLETALAEYSSKARLFVCQQGKGSVPEMNPRQRAGLFIGPEGGWSDEEKGIFSDGKLEQLNISDFTLRAETAAVVASARLLQ
jgi:16S rRNA (uracil1498-N3)-methyltransferase